MTKVWAVNALTDQPSKKILGDFFMLTLVFNEGGAMGTNLGGTNFYLIVAFIVIPVLCWLMYVRREQKYLVWPLALIVAGAIGNQIDRIRIGHVVDFIDFDFFDINIWKLHIDRWWTFNIADSAITCGLVFLIVYQMFAHRHHELPAPPPEAPADL